MFYFQQYLFYTLEVGNLSSSYSNTYSKTKELTSLLDNISKRNQTKPQNYDLKSMQDKLEKSIDTLLSYKIKETDKSYQLFNEGNKKHISSSIYLTRVVATISKMVTKLNNFSIPVDEGENIKKLEEELAIIQKIFKRRPAEALAFHFDLITNVLVNNNKEFKMVNAMEDVCGLSKTKDNSKNILVEMERVKTQVCAKQYNKIYNEIQYVIDDDYDETRNSLENLVNAYKNENDNITDIFKFFNER